MTYVGILGLALASALAGIQGPAADEAEARGIGETTNLVLFDAAPGATDGGCSTAPERHNREPSIYWN